MEKRARAETTHIVMSEDINQLGNLHGGTLMQWVDIIGAVAATRHARSTVTTAALDSMDFRHPVPLGAIVTLNATVTWTGRTSLEVRVDVYDGKPHEVPAFTPETESEKQEYERALIRRRNRLAARENEAN